MASSFRCRLLGCDLDECGICRRCGDDRRARHGWKEATRSKPCYRRMVCERCQTERESPDHDWATGDGTTSPQGDMTLECNRCGLRI